MTLYLNNMINRNEEEQLKKLGGVEVKLEEDQSMRKTSYNVKNLFWKKMRRVLSQRKRKDDQWEADIFGKTDSFKL